MPASCLGAQLRAFVAGPQNGAFCLRGLGRLPRLHGEPVEAVFYLDTLALWTRSVSSTKEDGRRDTACLRRAVTAGKEEWVFFQNCFFLEKYFFEGLIVLQERTHARQLHVGV